MRQKKSENQEQASRLKLVPRQLEEFIELWNLLEPGKALAEPAAILGNSCYPPYNDSRTMEFFTDFHKYIKALPAALQTFIWDGTARTIQPADSGLEVENSDVVTQASYVAMRHAVNRYHFYYHVRQLLREIARYSNQLLQKDVQPDSTTGTGLFIQSELIVAPNGTIGFETNRFIAALNGVEIKRIRECEICQRIFWAGRLNITCCTTKCAHVLRNRRLRQKHRNDPAGYQQRKIKEEKKRTGKQSNPKNKKTSLE